MRFDDLTEEQLKILLSTLKSVSRHTAHRWPKSITFDDIEQLVLEFLMDHSKRNVLKEAVSEDKDRRWMVLRKLANQVASQERRDYEQFSGNFYYSVDEVKSLLEDGILTGDSDDHVEEGVDLLEAMITLQKRESPYVDVILDRFGNFDKSVHHVKVNRALTALTDMMNDSHKARRIAYLERTEYGALA